MVILCDFDDTAADGNVATLLLEAFSKQLLTTIQPQWRDFRQQYVDAEISLAEYQERAFSGLSATRAEQFAYVQANAKLRHGFPALASYCLTNDIELAIVSHGLDYYIEALLDKEHLDHIPIFSVETAMSPAGEATYSYRYTREECPWQPGNCKCSLLDGYRARGHKVIYAGDGIADTCPGRKADFVFARDRLLRFCQAEGIPHRELTDFIVLLDYLKEQGKEGS